jgi:hypothetical protein
MMKIYGKLLKMSVVQGTLLYFAMWTNFLIGAKLVYLPPYSPDFNLIEECFSFMKAWLQRHEREAINPDVRPWLIHQALLAVTVDDVEGWFGNCGYIYFSIAIHEH